MNFIEYTNNWAKAEVTQGRIMIGIGIILLFVVYFIFRSQNDFLKGTLPPLALLIVVLLGYGSYILYSRPAHAKESIALYNENKAEAIQKEKEKHTNDNNWGEPLIKYVYPTFIIIFALALFFISNSYYRGMMIGLIFLFLTTYIIDNGFVTRSQQFLSYLNNIQ